MKTTHKFMTVKQYADMKEVSVQAVYKAIRAGKLKTNKVGYLTMVKPVPWIEKPENLTMLRQKYDKNQVREFLEHAKDHCDDVINLALMFIEEDTPVEEIRNNFWGAESHYKMKKREEKGKEMPEVDLENLLYKNPCIRLSHYLGQLRYLREEVGIDVFISKKHMAVRFWIFLRELKRTEESIKGFFDEFSEAYNALSQEYPEDVRPEPYRELRR